MPSWKISSEVIHRMIDSGQPVRLSAICIDDLPVGIAVARDGIKLPRDTFTFTDVTLHLEERLLNQPVVNTVLTALAKDAREHGSLLLRMTDDNSNPILKNDYYKHAVIEVGAPEAKFKVQPRKTCRTGILCCRCMRIMPGISRRSIIPKSRLYKICIPSYFTPLIGP